MSDRAKRLIFYGVLLAFLLVALWYINVDFSKIQSFYWVNVREKSSAIIVGENEILPPTEEELSSSIQKAHLLNINVATKNELVALETIGEVTAKKIISYRTENGYFKDIDELLSNSVITKRQFDAIKKEITV